MSTIDIRCYFYNFKWKENPNSQSHNPRSKWDSCMEEKKGWKWRTREGDSSWGMGYRIHVIVLRIPISKDRSFSDPFNLIISPQFHFLLCLFCYITEKVRGRGWIVFGSESGVPCEANQTQRSTLFWLHNIQSTDRNDALLSFHLFLLHVSGKLSKTFQRLGSWLLWPNTAAMYSFCKALTNAIPCFMQIMNHRLKGIVKQKLHSILLPSRQVLLRWFTLYHNI